MFAEISNPDNPKTTFTVGNFYRPPHIAVAQLTSFIDCFAEKLAQFNTNEKFYICGDININLLSLCSYKNIFRRLINQAKTFYYGTEFNRHRVNGKRTWRTLDNACTKK